MTYKITFRSHKINGEDKKHSSERGYDFDASFKPEIGSLIGWTRDWDLVEMVAMTIDALLKNNEKKEAIEVYLEGRFYLGHAQHVKLLMDLYSKAEGVKVEYKSTPLVIEYSTPYPKTKPVDIPL